MSYKLSVDTRESPGGDREMRSTTSSLIYLAGVAMFWGGIAALVYLVATR